MVDMRKATLALLLGCTFAAFGAVNAAVTASGPDLDKAGKEAQEMLAEYLRIDTTNPPGNEKLGAEYLANILRKNGIEPQIFDTDKNRACVYARLKGNGKKKAVVLLSHIDVVPAQAADWKYPPFKGEVHDGELWGRGAIDMKGMGIIELEALLTLKRQGKALDRDIIFLATPDEEMGADFGAKWIKEHKPELVKDAEFLLNEGFDIDATKEGKQRYWGINVAEKNVLWLKLTAKGTAGHASMPIADSAPNRLVRALNKLVNSPPKLTVLPMVHDYFTQISATVEPEFKEAYKEIDKSASDSKLIPLLLQDKLRSSMLRNTISLTVMKSGYKTNVIPGEAIAELDCRLLPGVDPDQFTEEVKRILDDPNVAISRLEWQKAEGSPAKSELFNAIKAVANEENPGVPVVPVIVGWFTDSHWFRDLGIVSYGFEPFTVDAEHLGTMHGINERIPLAQIDAGVARMYKILIKLAAPGA
jgi:acetylornithine deacetylase/succinyl-diaminopimelate desuccinylase-like protein